MESAESLQQLEMTALRSIYGNDFVEMPPPKVWKVRIDLSCFYQAVVC